MPLPPLLTALGTHIAVGGGLFYAVVKFFDTVGDRLNEQTRLEIAVWLLDLRTAQRVEPWPATFAKVFDRVFGERHLSWKCFIRSAVCSYIAVIVTMACLVAAHHGLPDSSWKYTLVIIVAGGSVGNIIPDYISLLETRLILRWLSRSDNWLLLTTLLICDLAVTFTLALTGAMSAEIADYAIVGWWRLGPSIWPEISGIAARKIQFTVLSLWLNPGSVFDLFLDPIILRVWLFAAFFTSIWLWLYAGAGFLLKGARRFDRLVAWMTAHMDIEKKPLQSIGLVAGAIVAVVYWGVVAVMRWV
jgi:hypothetical protein